MTGKRRAFTLIEMLVVIVVIGILSGMVFKMMQYAARDARKAATIQTLERVAHAVEEFRSEYGQYPPTTNIIYEYENVLWQSPWQRNNYFTHPGDWGSDAPILFQYGLISYIGLRERSNSHIEHKHTDGWVPANGRWIPDKERDLRAKRRWAPFLEGLVGEHVGPDGGQQRVASGGPYYNDKAVILDGWDRLINYECLPPYLTYRLWSVGADGEAGTGDDIEIDKMD